MCFAPSARDLRIAMVKLITCAHRQTDVFLSSPLPIPTALSEIHARATFYPSPPRPHRGEAPRPALHQTSPRQPRQSILPANRNHTGTPAHPSQEPTPCYAATIALSFVSHRHISVALPPPSHFERVRSTHPRDRHEAQPLIYRSPAKIISSRPFNPNHPPHAVFPPFFSNLCFRYIRAGGRGKGYT